MSKIADSALDEVRQCLGEEPHGGVLGFAHHWWEQMSMRDRVRLLDAAGLVSGRKLLSWRSQGGATRELILAAALMAALIS